MRMPWITRAPPSGTGTGPARAAPPRRGGFRRRSPPASAPRPARPPPPRGGARRTCLGTGLVVLDVVYPLRAAAPRCSAGGSCCNVLTILAWLGWQSCPVARLGDDPYAERILRDMARFGVDPSFVEADPLVSTPRIIQRTLGGTPPLPPRHEFLFSCEHGRRLPRWSAPGRAGREAAMGGVPAPDVFYFDRATAGALDMARRCRAAGSLVVFEPPAPPRSAAARRCAQAADVVKACRGAGGPLSGPWPDGGQLRIGTLSEDGLEYEAKLGKRVVSGRLPAVRTDSIADTSGAGDWLTAGFLHMLPGNRRPTVASRRSLERALRFGQSLSAINCRYAGARGAMYSNTAEAVSSAARTAASAGVVDPKMLGDGRGAAASAAPPGGRCAACTCGSRP